MTEPYDKQERQKLEEVLTLAGVPLGDGIAKHSALYWLGLLADHLKRHQPNRIAPEQLVAIRPTVERMHMLIFKSSALEFDQDGVTTLGLLEEIEKELATWSRPAPKFGGPLLSSTPGYPDIRVELDYVIIDELKLKTDLAKAAVPVLLELVAVLDQKQQDYGSENLTAFGAGGVMVRAYDKMARLKNLAKADPEHVKFESVADTWKDLTNYALIGFLMITGAWPKKKGDNEE